MMTKLLGALGALVLLFSLGCGNHCPPSIPVDAPAQGTLSARWTITTADQLVSCALVGAASVALTLHPHAGGNDVTLTSACAVSMTTGSVAVGAYDVTPSLLSADGQPIASAAPQTAVVLTAGQAIDLAPITFALTARTGDIALRLVAVGQGTNCQTMSGKPISRAILTLQSTDGQCANVAITRSRGGVFIGKYLTSCDQPVGTTCFEQDETLSVDGGITEGQYVITVSGLAGASVCFAAQDVLTVGPGITNHATVQLAPLRGSGC
jgi:hypothetical protein